MWLSIWHAGVHKRLDPGQTIDYSSIVKYSRSGRWLISHKKKDPVMQGVPEASLPLLLDEMEQQIQKKLQQQKRGSRRRTTRRTLQ